MQLEVISREPKSEARPTPILFVHGMWHGAWCWSEYFLPYFAQQGYRAYALSLRGHGASEGRERLRWTSLSQYVEDVEQVASQLERPPILVGHSMGGMIVQKYLELHEAPAAVLLSAVPPKGLFGATLRVARQHPLVFTRINLKLSLYPVVGTPKRCREFLFSPDIPENKLASYYALMQDESYRAYLDMVIFNLPKTENIKTDLLILGARNDRAILPSEVEATARTYGTQAEIFPDMAHDIMLEPGWQKVSDRIIDWLKQKGL